MLPPVDVGTATHTAALPDIRVHDLRHTYATLALEAAVHPTVVSERLGHAHIGVTMGLYSHVSEGMEAIHVSDDRCLHDKLPGQCSSCGQPHGFVTDGGSHYHRAAGCRALVEGQNQARSRGQKAHGVRGVPLAEATGVLGCARCSFCWSQR